MKLEISDIQEYPFGVLEFEFITKVKCNKKNPNGMALNIKVEIVNYTPFPTKDDAEAYMLAQSLQNRGRYVRLLVDIESLKDGE